MQRSLDQLPEAEADPVRLMVIGDSKTGKSTMSAEAAILGFHVAYFDSDNGLSAIQFMLKDKNEAKKRLQYFPVLKPVEFWKGLLKSTTAMPFGWVPRLSKAWGKLLLDIKPDDVVWSFDITRFPKDGILVQDSWTAMAMDALGIGSKDQLAELLDEDVNTQGIYGDANSNLTYIANMIQKLPCHVIVQAHGTIFEKYDKPLNKTAQEAKQKEFRLIEIQEVPVSSSRPHGAVVASRFNHIGWLSINGMGETEIDFTRSNRRIGGGPPNIKDKVKNLNFAKLVGKVPEFVEPEGWFIETTHAAILEASKAQGGFKK